MTDRSLHTDIWDWWAELKWRWLECHWRECLQCALSAGELPLADEPCAIGRGILDGYLAVTLDQYERR